MLCVFPQVDDRIESDRFKLSGFLFYARKREIGLFSRSGQLNKINQPVFDCGKMSTNKTRALLFVKTAFCNPPLQRLIQKFKDAKSCYRKKSDEDGQAHPLAQPEIMFQQ